jgi:hypothetical protein
MASSRSDTIEIFARRDFARWYGLPASTSIDDVADILDVDRSWHGAGFLGSDKRSARWLSAAAPGFGQGIRVWIDDAQVLLLDAPSLTLVDGVDVDVLLRGLGKPAAELESYLGTLAIARSELVYPERGLTLYVNPENGILLRAVAYEPGKLEHYMRRLRLDLRARRLPHRHQVPEGA